MYLSSIKKRCVTEYYCTIKLGGSEAQCILYGLIKNMLNEGLKKKDTLKFLYPVASYEVSAH